VQSFDTVNHAWMLRLVGHRLGDPRIIRLIQGMLKGGIMEEGLVRASEEGTPQGSILSPLLSNIYGRLFGRKGTVALMLS
jgi:RNA-directed DNA polymerase